MTPPVRDELTPIQSERLSALLTAVASGNSFWRERFAAASFAPEACRWLADLRRLPLLSKADLVADQLAHPPYGSNLTDPLDRYVRFHQTSGTTGQPQPWLDTAASWAWLVRCWQTIYDRASVPPGAVVAFPFSFGPFIGFWAAHEGAVARGCRSLTLGGLSTEQRLREIVRHRANVLCCTPTYALRMAEVADEIGLDLAETAIERLIVAGEPGGNVPATRTLLSRRWNGARVIDHWGMSDVGSLAVEPHDDAGHLVVLEDECIAEVIDPATGRPTDGLGELVITNLGRHGMPVIRYRTGDLVKPTAPDATTGWLRLEGGIRGRVDDMIVIRGNNVFPSSVETIVREQPDVAEFRLVVTERRSMPHLRIELEPSPGVTIDQAIAAIETACLDRLHFRAEVIAVAAGSLPRFEMKAKRLVDQRPR